MYARLMIKQHNTARISCRSFATIKHGSKITLAEEAIETRDDSTTEKNIHLEGNDHTNSKKMTLEEQKAWKVENESRGLGPGHYFTPTPMEKVKLVIGGAYRSLSEVPDVVRPTVYERARDYYMIYLNLSIVAVCVALTLLGHHLVKKDREFAEKYGISMDQDETRRRHRHQEERKAREARRKQLEMQSGT